jgi:hypothetical protein
LIKLLLEPKTKGATNLPSVPSANESDLHAHEMGVGSPCQKVRHIYLKEEIQKYFTKKSSMHAHTHHVPYRL